MATILIVDDDPTLREALAEAVRDLGHEARSASSGSAAVDILESERIDAAFIDLRMPGMDGLELLGRIRARDEPPIVTVLTAHASAANTIEAMRLGAFDHLTKPIGRADVAQILSRMLSVGSATPGNSAADSEKLVGRARRCVACRS